MFEPVKICGGQTGKHPVTMAESQCARNMSGLLGRFSDFQKSGFTNRPGNTRSSSCAEARLSNALRSALVLPNAQRRSCCDTSNNVSTAL